MTTRRPAGLYYEDLILTVNRKSGVAMSSRASVSVPAAVGCLLTLLTLAACGGGNSRAAAQAASKSAAAAMSGSAARSSAASAGTSTPTRSKASVASGATPHAAVSGQPSTTLNQVAGQEGNTAPAAQEQCKITSAAAVKQIFGAQVGSETGGLSGTGSTVCRFVLSNSNLGRGVVISLSIHQPTARASFEQSKAAAVKAGAAALSGVGDSAYYQAGSADLQFIHGTTLGAVQTSARAATLQVANRIRAELTSLAQSVSATLP